MGIFLVFAISLLVLELVGLVLNAILYVRVISDLDPIVKAAKLEKDMAKGKTEDAVEKSRENLIDEGFENIMRFSVNGKTGMEEDSVWR